MEEYKKQLSVEVINDFIHFSFQISKNWQNEHFTVHNFLNNTRKLFDKRQSGTEKIQAFRKFCKDNIIIFSVIENVFSKKKFQQILDIKTIYQDGSQSQTNLWQLFFSLELFQFLRKYSRKSQV